MLLKTKDQAAGDPAVLSLSIAVLWSQVFTHLLLQQVTVRSDLCLQAPQIPARWRHFWGTWFMVWWQLGERRGVPHPWCGCGCLAEKAGLGPRSQGLRNLGHAGAVLAWLAVPLAPGNTTVGNARGPTVSELLPVGSSFEAGICSFLLRARPSWELSRMKLKARKPRGR